MCNAVSYELLMQKLQVIDSTLVSISNLITQSPPWYINSVDPTFAGCGMGIIRTGNSYNIWGTGAFTATRSFSGGTSYYLSRQGRADYLDAMSMYQGPPTVFTVWFSTNSGETSLPLYFDQTGIFVRTTSTMSNVSGTFAFTATLMLN
ncbi:MAG: hypothetical protein FWE40_10130 [Oscillospiraceae bacterium]|nr:hypothetical protein [Oscillospiraceae bacterium]